MSASDFVDLQEALLFVFRPVVETTLGFLFGASVLAAILILILDVFAPRRLGRSDQNS